MLAAARDAYDIFDPWVPWKRGQVGTVGVVPAPALPLTYPALRSVLDELAAVRAQYRDLAMQPCACTRSAAAAAGAAATR